MTTVSHVWGRDLTLAAQGDIAATDGLTASQQAVARRLCTYPGEYIFHPDYGCGLQLYIGKAFSPTLWAGLKSKILKNIKKEATVMQVPAPVLSYDLDPRGSLLSVTIQYTDQDGPQTLTLQEP